MDCGFKKDIKTKTAKRMEVYQDIENMIHQLRSKGAKEYVDPAIAGYHNEAINKFEYCLAALEVSAIALRNAAIVKHNSRCPVCVPLPELEKYS